MHKEICRNNNVITIKDIMTDMIGFKGIKRHNVNNLNKHNNSNTNEFNAHFPYINDANTETSNAIAFDLCSTCVGNDVSVANTIIKSNEDSYINKLAQRRNNKKLYHVVNTVNMQRAYDVDTIFNSLSKSYHNSYHFTTDILKLSCLLKSSNEFNNVIDVLKSNTFQINNQYNLFITGSISSGKSTLCELLSILLDTISIKTNNYPEFLGIDLENGNKMLQNKLNGSISAYTFQNYILDMWEHILKQQPLSNNINLFERCVDDSVICFSNYDNLKHKISDNELYSLYEKSQLINKKYNIPSYFVHGTKFLFTTIEFENISNMLYKLLLIVVADLKHNVTNRVIGITTNNFNDNITRMNGRNRKGEENYKNNDMYMYNVIYNNIYNTLLNGRFIDRYVDIALLCDDTWIY